MNFSSAIQGALPGPHRLSRWNEGADADVRRCLSDCWRNSITFNSLDVPHPAKTLCPRGDGIDSFLKALPLTASILGRFSAPCEFLNFNFDDYSGPCPVCHHRSGQSLRAVISSVRLFAISSLAPFGQPALTRSRRQPQILPESPTQPEYLFRCFLSEAEPIWKSLDARSPTLPRHLPRV